MCMKRHVKRHIIGKIILAILIIYIFIINFPFPIKMHLKGIEIDMADINHVIVRDIRIEGSYCVNSPIAHKIDEFRGKIEIMGYDEGIIEVKESTRTGIKSYRYHGKIDKSWEMSPIRMEGDVIEYVKKEGKKNYSCLMCWVYMDNFMQNMVFNLDWGLSCEEGRVIVVGAETRKEALEIISKKYGCDFYLGK